VGSLASEGNRYDVAGDERVREGWGDGAISEVEDQAKLAALLSAVRDDIVFKLELFEATRSVAGEMTKRS
jgi:hypothetical protein